MKFSRSAKKPRGTGIKIPCLALWRKRCDPEAGEDMISEANRIIEESVAGELCEFDPMRKRRAVFRAVIITALLGTAIVAGIAVAIIL